MIQEAYDLLLIVALDDATHSCNGRRDGWMDPRLTIGLAF
jgi:hypothetical protein